jgi:hypothetical protein
MPGCSWLLCAHLIECLGSKRVRDLSACQNRSKATPCRLTSSAGVEIRDLPEALALAKGPASPDSSSSVGDTPYSQGSLGKPGAAFQRLYSDGKFEYSRIGDSNFCDQRVIMARSHRPQPYMGVDSLPNPPGVRETSTFVVLLVGGRSPTLAGGL